MSHGAMNLKFTEARLAQVLVAPIVSEKATSVAEKHNQVLFKVLRDATKPEIKACLLYTSDAADERSSVDLGGRRIIKKKKRHE